MPIFFSLLIAIGLVMIYLEWYGARHSDSVPGSLAFLGNKGLAAVAIGIVGLVCLWLSPGRAHDHSRPELTPWLKSLHAKDKTWCCDGNDTDAIEAWETKGNRYRVKYRGEWFDVPEGSVVDGPNNGGDALLWMNKGYSGVSVRCFMPGPLT